MVNLSCDVPRCLFGSWLNHAKSDSLVSGSATIIQEGVLWMPQKRLVDRSSVHCAKFMFHTGRLFLSHKWASAPWDISCEFQCKKSPQISSNPSPLNARTLIPLQQSKHPSSHQVLHAKSHIFARSETYHLQATTIACSILQQLLLANKNLLP